MWPPEAIEFLRELDDNNDRDWFKANRARYDAHLVEPARALAERLADLGAPRLLPGHGPVADNPAEVIAYYVRHRAERLREVEAAVHAGARTAREVVERVYADVDRALWGAAEQSVRAQLDLLVETGRVTL